MDDLTQSGELNNLSVQAVQSFLGILEQAIPYLDLDDKASKQVYLQAAGLIQKHELSGNEQFENILLKAIQHGWVGSNKNLLKQAIIVMDRIITERGMEALTQEYLNRYEIYCEKIVELSKDSREKKEWLLKAGKVSRDIDKKKDLYIKAAKLSGSPREGCMMYFQAIMLSKDATQISNLRRLIADCCESISGNEYEFPDLEYFLSIRDAENGDLETDLNEQKAFYLKGIEHARTGLKKAIDGNQGDQELLDNLWKELQTLYHKMQGIIIKEWEENAKDMSKGVGIPDLRFQMLAQYAEKKDLESINKLYSHLIG